MPLAKVKASIAALVVAGLAILAYSLASLLGKTPMSWLIFFGLLGLLQVFNLNFIFQSVRAGDLVSIKGKLLTILWGGLGIWYWFFAPIFLYLNLNLDQLQLRWTVFVYLWEVPIVGGVFILIALLFFAPISKFLKEGNPQEADKIYDSTSRYPSLVAVFILIFSTIGYVLGTVQFHFFSFLPPIESAKVMLNGIAVSILLGVVYYVLLDNLLNTVRLSIRKKFSIKQPIKRNISRKIFSLIFLITIGTFAILSLFVVKSFQDVIKGQIKRELSETIESGDQNNLLKGDRGEVFYIDAKESLSDNKFSKETIEFFEKNSIGITEDNKSNLKLVALVKNEKSEEKIVSVVYLQDFYEPLGNISHFFVISSGLLLLVLLGITYLVSMEVSRSLRELARSVEEAEKGTPFVFETTSGDEIESLAAALSRFIKVAQDLRTGLEKTVAEKTSELREKILRLDKLNKVMVDRELMMTKMKKEIEELKKPKLKK